MSTRALLLSILCVLGACAPTPDGLETPRPCEDPLEEARVSAVEVGIATPFEAVDDGAELMLDYGAQGGQMVTFSLRLETEADGACIDKQVTLYNAAGDQVGQHRGALPVSAVDGGLVSDRFSMEVYNNPRPGAPVTVVVEAYGAEKVRNLVYEGTFQDTGDTGF